MTAFDRIGSLPERIKNRLGREFGHCRTCGKPTKSVRVGNGLQCWTCYDNGERVVLADGGVSFSREQRQLFAQRLREAGLDTKRFIQVHDGEKRSTNHTQYEPDDARIKGNYGVYPGKGASDSGEGYLVNVDIDDYETDETNEALEAIQSLPETFTVASPHTDGETGGHKSYKVTGPLLERIEEIAGPETTNLKLSWGEIRSDNQYVVGPGSQLHGCDKDWCDECAEHNGGYYEITNDVPIAEITAEELIGAVLEDPNYPKDTPDEGDRGSRPEADYDLDIDVEPDTDREFTNKYAETLDELRERDEKLDALLSDLNPSGLGYPSRSEADSAAAWKLVYYGFDVEDVATILQTYRPYEKTFRHSSLQPTLSKALSMVPQSYTPPAGDGDRWSATLPPAIRDLSQQTGEITRQDVYERTHRAIKRAIDHREDVLIDAIMGSGKTYNTFKAAHDTGVDLFYASPRIELYAQGEEYALKNGFEPDEVKILPSMKRDCPTFQGEHGAEWANRVKSQYGKGVMPRAIHDLNDDIPCMEGDDCPYKQKWDFEPDDYRVLIGHYKHAHVPLVTKGRVCAFDEEPVGSFISRIEGDELVTGINAFLSLADSPPIEDFHDLLVAREDDDRRQAALDWFAGFDHDEPDERNVVRFENQDFHAYAPHAVYVILRSQPIDEGYDFEYGQLPGKFNGGLFFTGDEDQTHYVEIKTPPNLEYARNVVALDGTPLVDDRYENPHKPREWITALSTNLDHRRVLTDVERPAFLDDTMDHTYIQTSPHIRPYSSGKYASKSRDGALLSAVTLLYGEGDAPVVFTSKTVEEDYQDFLDAGIVKAFEHPGNLRGSNEHADERLAVQLGSSHHGDHELKRRAAWLREAVYPEGKGVDRDYGELGNELLKQMRENQTAQNVLRVGRKGEGAVIVLDTCAFPEYIHPVNDVGDGLVETWSPAMREIVDIWGNRESTRTAEIAADINVDESTARRALKRLDDRGHVDRNPHPEDGRAIQWSDDGISQLQPYGTGDCELPEIELDASEEVPRDPSMIYSYVKRAPDLVETDIDWPPPYQSTFDAPVNPGDPASNDD